MPLARDQRRLAVIVAIDVVGYSRLMGRNESGTHALLKIHLAERVGPSITRRGGRVVKLTGDGALAEFDSAVNALSAVIELQQAMADANRDQPEADRIVFRAGVHLGDVIVEDDDLYGDDVNIAVRLQGESPPGSILISRAVREAVTGRIKAELHALGELSLKNIVRPIRAFRVEWQGADWTTDAHSQSFEPAGATPASPVLALPDKPSIAVLPFQNMSGDPEQEYFADGMVEDIITALSRFKSLFVIARNASFTYKGKAVDIKQVGRELGVRYVLEGSVRKAAGRLRITGQLIDVETQTNIWVDQFDGSLEDVFALQDQVATSVVARIAPRVGRAEIERAMRKPVNDPNAYDCYLRALAVAAENTPESNQEALRLCARAITLDPGFAAPYGLAATCYATRKSNYWTDDAKADAAETRRLVSHVSKIGGDDALALSRAGWSLATVCNNVEDGAALIDEGLSYNPNLAIAWTNRGMVSVLLGHHEAALDQFRRARRLSPIGKATDRSDVMMAFAHFFMGDNGEALNWASKVLRKDPNMPTALGVAAMANALAGNIDEARKLVVRLRQILPALRLTNLKEYFRTTRRPEDIERAAKAMHLAGLPE
jgi:TolB-like protein/class 3 adenylate cyclase